MSISEQVTQLRQDIDGVYAAGRKAQYDEFWDAYQENGGKTRYANAFAGRGWRDSTFCPKYNILPDNAYMMFYDADVTDPFGIMAKLGLTIDTSNTTNFQYAFSLCRKIKHLGIIDMRKGTNANAVFQASSALVTIEKIISSEDTAYVNTTFSSLLNLTNITFEGVIAKSIDFKTSPLLNQTSILSIIRALATGITGQTCTFSVKAVNKAFETSEGANDGSNSEHWGYSIADKKNWTISLV